MMEMVVQQLLLSVQWIRGFQQLCRNFSWLQSFDQPFLSGGFLDFFNVTTGGSVCLFLARPVAVSLIFLVSIFAPRVVQYFCPIKTFCLHALGGRCSITLSLHGSVVVLQLLFLGRPKEIVLRSGGLQFCPFNLNCGL